MRGLNLDKTYFYRHVLPCTAEGRRIIASQPMRETDPVSPASPVSDAFADVESRDGRTKRKTLEPDSAPQGQRPSSGQRPHSSSGSQRPGSAVKLDAPEGKERRAGDKAAGGATPKVGQTPRSLQDKQAAATQARRAQRTKTEKVGRSTSGGSMGNPDFDLYLTERLVPLLAQALDGLGRELIRQHELGDKMDKAVQRRFNPRTWLAQYLIRNDPKVVQTPRRGKVYADFGLWTDLERGRREVLRRREAVKVVFMGFTKRNVMQAKDIPKLFSALDQMWWLEGTLKNNPLLPASYDNLRSEWTFQQFWEWFSDLVLSNDFLPYAEFQAGVKRAMAEEERKLQEEADREQREAEEKARLAAKEEERLRFVEAAEACKANVELQRILNEGMELTGAISSMEDINAEYEIGPYGEHVKLMIRLLRVLGFDSLPDPDEKPPPTDQLSMEQGQASGGTSPSKKASKKKLRRGSVAEQAMIDNLQKETWWEDPALTCWEIVQRAMDAEVQDGIVDRHSLAFATDVENWTEVRKVVTREREKAEMLGLGDVVADARARMRALEDAQEAMEEEMEKTKALLMAKKRTYDQLAKEYDLTDVRIEWLHEQFKAMLDEGEEDNYPMDPASLSKEKMRELYADLKPDMADDEFDQQFEEIDEDGSGEIEFDEFIRWIYMEEIDLGEDDEEDEEFEEEASP